MNDDFEAVLDRCRERLSEISLDLPELEKGAPPVRRYDLGEPPRRAAEAPAEPVAPPPARPEPVAAPDPTPAPAHADDEPEIFPPPRPRELTPVPLPPSRTPAPAVLAVRPRVPPAAWAAGTAAVLLAVAAGLWARRTPAELEVSLPGVEAVAVRSDKGDFVAARAGELVEVAADGTVRSASALEEPVSSLSWSRGSLWSADGRTPEISERVGSGRPTVFRLNHVPSAIHAAGGSLWTIEKGGRQIHQYLISRSILGAMLQPLDIFELPGLSPADLTVDESGTLWVYDETSRRICRLRPKGGSYELIDAAAVSPLVGPSASILDFELDGASIWLLTRAGADGSSVLRRIPVSKLVFTAG